MNKYLCFLLFSLIFNLGYSQTEEDYIQTIKVHYAKNNKSKACEESKKGLTKFPNSARIAKLQALVCGVSSNSQVNNSNANINEGSKQTVIDGGNKNIPNSNGTVVRDNPASQIDNPKPIDKIVNVSTGFKRIAGQNRVEWSKSLTDNAVSITIRYTVKGVGVLVDEQVTGRTYHIYDPGTSRAHGRSTKVELIVDYGDKKVNESGTLVIEDQFFVCSAN